MKMNMKGFELWVHSLSIWVESFKNTVIDEYVPFKGVNPTKILRNKILLFMPSANTWR